MKRTSDMAEGDQQGLEVLKENIGALEIKFQALKRKAGSLSKGSERLGSILKEWERFYDTAPVGLHTIDSDGTILKMNQTELDWLGYTREEVEGKMSSFEILAPESHKTYFQMKEEGLKRKKGPQVELKYITKNGTVLSRLCSNIGVYNEDGSIRFIRVNLWDIEDRKKIENELLRFNNEYKEFRMKLEARNNDIDRAEKELEEMKVEKQNFIETFDKQIQDPLEEIQQLSMDLFQHGKGPEANGIIKTIYEKVNAMNKFVTDYVASRTGESGKPGGKEISYDLSGLVVSTIYGFEEQMDAKGISLDIDIYEQYNMLGNKVILSQILDKLMKSAVDIAQKGKEIMVSIRKETERYVLEVLLKRKGAAQEGVKPVIEKDESEEGKEARPTWDKEIELLAKQAGFQLKFKGPDDEGNALARLFLPFEEE